MPSYVIVGASRGLGYQFLKALSKDPSNKIVGVVRAVGPTQAKVTADNLSNVHIIQGDLTDPVSLNAAAKQASEYTGGAVDHVVVNGAYLSEATLFLKPSDYIGKDKLFLDELNASMNANVAGAFFAVNAFLPYVQKSSIKKIIVISSGHADPDIIPVSELAEAIPYAISKAATTILVAKLAVEYKKDGIIFLALSPGFVLTQFESFDQIPPPVAAAYEKLGDQFRKYEPNFKRQILPEESVDKQLKVIEGITIKDSGAFLSHLGNKRWL